jgi:hypothetical protein
MRRVSPDVVLKSKTGNNIVTLWEGDKWLLLKEYQYRFLMV